MSRQLFGEGCRRVDPVRFLKGPREAELRESRHCLRQLRWRKSRKIGELPFDIPAFGRKLPVVNNQFPKQQRNETEQKLPQHCDVAYRQALRLCWIAAKTFRNELIWKHGYANSTTGLPCE